MDELRYAMTRRRVDAYVVGAANAGKSSFINDLMDVELTGRGGGVEAGRRQVTQTSTQPQPFSGVTFSVFFACVLLFFDTWSARAKNKLEGPFSVASPPDPVTPTLHFSIRCFRDFQDFHTFAPLQIHV